MAVSSLKGRLASLGVVTAFIFALAGSETYARSGAAHRVVDVHEIIERDFARHDPDYARKRDYFQRKLQSSRHRLLQLQARGTDLPCSDQIYVEAKWLLNYTTHWERLELQIGRLEQSLNVRDQRFAHEQSPDDGLWGVCYAEWFLKLDATVDALNDLVSRNAAPRYPLTGLQPIATEENLLRMLRGLLVSDIARTGADRRNELGAVTAAASQLLFKTPMRTFLENKARGFTPSEGLVDGFLTFLDEWQDRRTGYWGPLYWSDDSIYRNDDLSITYHIIAYREGKVKRWAEIANSTLQLNDTEYPNGWLRNGSYNHHNNYDVVRILALGWTHMSGAQKRRAREEIRKMLYWCIRDAIDLNGSFIIDPHFYNSVSHNFYFGVSFLEIIGYWNKTKRFWTDEEFPDAASLCCRLKAILEKLGLQSVPARAAMNRLAPNCSVCT